MKNRYTIRVDETDTSGVHGFISRGIILTVLNGKKPKFIFTSCRLKISFTND